MIMLQLSGFCQLQCGSLSLLGFHKPAGALSTSTGSCGVMPGLSNVGPFHVGYGMGASLNKRQHWKVQVYPKFPNLYITETRRQNMFDIQNRPRSNGGL